MGDKVGWLGWLYTRLVAKCYNVMVGGMVGWLIRLVEGLGSCSDSDMVGYFRLHTHV